MEEGVFKLSEEELKMIEETINTPGWEVIKRVNKRMAEDWIGQTAMVDFSEKTDDEVKNIVRFRQGMIKGMILLIRYIEKKVNTKVVQD